jgi:hypothetical protein
MDAQITNGVENQVKKVQSDRVVEQMSKSKARSLTSLTLDVLECLLVAI